MTTVIHITADVRLVCFLKGSASSPEHSFHKDPPYCSKCEVEWKKSESELILGKSPFPIIPPPPWRGVSQGVSNIETGTNMFKRVDICSFTRLDRDRRQHYHPETEFGQKVEAHLAPRTLPPQGFHENPHFYLCHHNYFIFPANLKLCRSAGFNSLLGTDIANVGISGWTPTILTLYMVPRREMRVKVTSFLQIAQIR